jgi:MarR family transcriptional regulator, negative regulator of the multidrug operon emrRAB
MKRNHYLFLSMPLNVLDTIEQHVLSISRRHPDFPTQFALVLRAIKLFGWHLNNMAHGLLKTWGVTYMEYNVLTTLYGSESHVMSIADLSGAVGEPSGQISRVVQVLHKRGLVLRSHDKVDRRKVTVSLDNAGVTLMEKVLPVINTMANDYLQSFAPGEMDELLRLLKKSMKSMG